MVTTTYTFYPNYGQCAYPANMTITVDPVVTPTFNQAAVICSGDSLSALPTSSIEGILGTWSPAINNLATTTYTFTPNAGQSAITATMTITVTPSVTPIFNQVPVICYGESLSALPTTSLEGITGTWSPAINNLATTTYTFTPNAGQCAATAVMTITVYHTEKPVTYDQTFCISQAPTIAFLHNNFKWYSTLTGGTALSADTALVSGNYYASQTLNGCESDRSMAKITILPAVIPDFTQVASICAGANLAALPLTSIDGYAGTWSPAINNLATTTYTFTPNWYYCASPATMTIVVRGAGTIAGGNVTVCTPGTALNSDGVSTVFTNSTTLNLTGNSAGSTILWQKSTNFVNATNATPVWSTVANTTTTTNNVLINGNTLKVSNLTIPTWYRAKATNGTCITYTDPVKISLSPLAKAGLITSLSSVCAGGSITFTSAAYTGSAIAWEVSTTSATAGFSTVAGENGLTFTMNNAPSVKFYVRSVITSGACSIARSAVKTITVSPPSVGGIVAGGGAVCLGSNKVLKISGYTGTIQWMYATDGTNFMNVPTGSGVAPTFVTTSATGTGTSYVVNNITGTAYFKAVLKSGACSTSESNVVVFNTATTASQVDLSVESAQVCSGAATSLYLPLFVGDVKIQKSINWTSARPTWTTVTLKMTQTLYNGQYGAFSTGALTQTTAYRAISSIGSCAPVVYGSIAVIGVYACATTREIETPAAITTPFEVIAYPNPSNNVFNFKVNGADDETVSILVFDMTGRQVDSKVVNASDVENIALGQNYASGVYNVIISQGMNTKTVRLVKN